MVSEGEMKASRSGTAGGGAVVGGGIRSNAMAGNGQQQQPTAARNKCSRNPIDLTMHASGESLFFVCVSFSSALRCCPRRVQCVAESESSFESRKALPEPWRGLRDDALSAAAGIDGCVFCHASGFIGGAASKEAALAMAVKALEDTGNKKQKIDETASSN